MVSVLFETFLTFVKLLERAPGIDDTVRLTLGELGAVVAGAHRMLRNLVLAGVAITLLQQVTHFPTQ